MLFNNPPFPHNSKILSNGYTNTLLTSLTKPIFLWKGFLIQIYLVIAALQLTWYWLAVWILWFVGEFVTCLHSWFWLTAFFINTLYFNEDSVWIFLWWALIFYFFNRSEFIQHVLNFNLPLEVMCSGSVSLVLILVSVTFSCIFIYKWKIFTQNCADCGIWT